MVRERKRKVMVATNTLNKGANQIQCNTAFELVQNHHLSQTVATTYPIHPLPSEQPQNDIFFNP
jgi:hypothetical protein